MIKIAILGDILHSRVALSNIYALKMLGANVKLCAPKSLIPKNIEPVNLDSRCTFKSKNITTYTPR